MIHAPVGFATSRFVHTASNRALRLKPAAYLALALLLSSARADVLLNWTTNSNNETGFRLERAPSTMVFAQIATVGASVVTYTDTGVADSTQYSYRVRATNASGDSAFSNTDTVMTLAPNTAPTISPIANQPIAEDASTGALAFTIGDAETAAASLTVSGASSNLALVPNANITFGGSGANRTVSVAPLANQSGTATITVTVSDGSLTGSAAFLLTVNAVNDAPTISNIADRTINEDATTGAVAFTVGDAETTAGSLTLSGSSSNTALVPSANITFGGSGTARTITIHW